MPDEIEFQKLKKQYPGFFEKLPPKLLKIILSEETFSQISKICLENGVADEEKIEDISYHIASVLLGKLPRKILSKAVQINSKLDAKTAEKISSDANRLIFSQIPLTNDEAPLIPPPKKDEREREPKKPDIYHEPVE